MNTEPIPELSRADVLRVASLRALRSIVETSQMTEPEWRATLLNLIDRLEKQDAEIYRLHNPNP